MKWILLLVLALVGGTLLWLRRPAPEMVDAGGAALTAGVADGGASGELFGTPELAAAAALLEAGQSAEALASLLAILENSERDGETCLLLSRAFRAQDDLDEAEAYGERAVLLLPESAEAHYALSMALTEKMAEEGMLYAMKTLPHWRAMVRRAIELDPAHVEARVDEITYYLVVPGIAGGDVERGLELVAELEAIDPKRGMLLRSIGLSVQEQPDEALALCRAGAEQYPDAPDFHLSIGRMLSEADEVENADAAYAEAMTRALAGRAPAELTNKERSSYCQALYARARLRQTKEFGLEEALIFLDEHLTLDPRGRWMADAARVHLRRGEIFTALERPDEARAALEEALALDPELEEAQAALRELEG